MPNVIGGGNSGSLAPSPSRPGRKPSAPRLNEPERTLLDALGTPASLPATNPVAVEPTIAKSEPQSLTARRRKGLRQTILTGPGGVSSGPVARQTLLGN